MKLKHYILGIAIIIIDQLSKILVLNTKISLIPNFLSITYTENRGGAFGVGTRYIVMLISIIIIVGIIAYIIYERKKIINYVPLLLILSGSIGNLIDRIFRGYVVDFIDFNIFNFPNFNIADICITLGIFLIGINAIKNVNKNKEKGDEKETN